MLKEKNLEEGSKSLIAGSTDYRYLKCIDLLTKKKLALSEDELKYIKSFIEERSDETTRKVDIRYKLLKYDEAKTDDEKAQILNEFNAKYLNLTFNHQKPGNLMVKADKKAEVKEERKDTKILDSVDPNFYLDKIYKGELKIHELSKPAMLKLDLGKLKDDDFICFLDIIGDDLPMIDSDVFYTRCAKLISGKNKQKKMSENSIINFTLEQLEKLIKKDSDLIKTESFLFHYIQKKFFKELSHDTDITDDEKRANLIKVYDYAVTLPVTFTRFKSTILFHILENGIKTDKYEKNYFMAYLKNPLNDAILLKRPPSDASPLHNLTQSLRATFGNPSSSRKIIEKYLEHFFIEGDAMEMYLEYVDDQFLKIVSDNTLLMSGNEVVITEENSKELETLGRQVRVNFEEKNKDLFNIGEDINLWVELKNVSTLFIKVFEINTENYYRKNMAAFKTDINLDGLVACIEKTLDFRLGPQIRFWEELKFPELKGKTGLYVIELIGNGISSRAVIKIGTLSVISHETSAGQICYILDGERNICCHESTGIWMDNKYYKANTEKGGRILIPYLPCGGRQVTNAILLHQGLAQLVTIERLEEQYSFKCGF